MSTIMTYGGYNFSPVPLLTINKVYNKTGDGRFLGATFHVTLKGTLVSTNPGGYPLIDSKQDDLRAAFNSQGELFYVQCNGHDIILTYPRIINIDFQPTSNNWVFTSDFTIELEWDEDPEGMGEDATLHPYITDAKEEWNVEFVDSHNKYRLTLSTGLDSNPYELRLTHQLSAVGKSHYDAGGLVKPAWQQARDYVVQRLGYDDNYVVSSGVMNLTANSFSGYNYLRTNVTDVNGGTFSVNESWLVIDPSTTGVAGRALEEFTVDIKNSFETDITTISIQGSVQGLETKTYGANPGDFTVNETKYEAASGYFVAIKPRLLPRVTLIGGTTSRPINIRPVASSVGHNVPNGVITYSYEYNDRLSNCITGALTETIVINDTNPNDVFATLQILGRASGPVLQDLSTVTAFSRDVSINCVMAPATGCPTTFGIANALMAASPKTQVYNLLNAFYLDLTTQYGQVFKSKDSESWEPKNGRYSRNVSWTTGRCS